MGYPAVGHAMGDHSRNFTFPGGEGIGSEGVVCFPPPAGGLSAATEATSSERAYSAASSADIAIPWANAASHASSPS